MSEPLFKASYPVTGMDFVAAGSAASHIKRTLMGFGLEQEICRRAAIAAYEAEMNVVIHGGGGQMCFTLFNEEIVIEALDDGPGIPDIHLAMQEGYTTASDEIREMGFGAGMGLPNINRCVSLLLIESFPGRGTHLTMKIFLDHHYPI